MSDEIVTNVLENAGSLSVRLAQTGLSNENTYNQDGT